MIIQVFLPINVADNTSFDNLADLSVPTHLTSDRPLISAERFPSQLPQSVKDIFSNPELPYTSSKFQAVYDILENKIPVEEKVIVFVGISYLVSIFWSN